MIARAIRTDDLIERAAKEETIAPHYAVSMSSNRTVLSDARFGSHAAISIDKKERLNIYYS